MGNNVIRTITVRGFKGIKAIENLEMRPINVVIGANGAGKSNFLGVFEMVGKWAAGRIHFYLAQQGGARKLLHFGLKETERLKVEIRLEDPETTCTFELQASVGDQIFPMGSYHSEKPATGLSGEETLRRLRVYHFADTGFSSGIKGTSKIDDNSFLRGDGSNLAAILYLLQELHPNELRLIRQVVRQVAPFFDDFVLKPVELNSETIILRWLHKGSDDYFDADSLSDGTLRFIALATLLLQPVSRRPPVILIDEPELGLHPAAITLLSALVEKAAVDTQIIFTTQSPQLLDHFEPEDVLVADRVDGGTTMKRLESEPLAVWMEDYSLGQLWEKNEFDGQPVPE